MIQPRRFLLTTLLLVLGAAPAAAVTFVEHFDGAALDPGLAAQADPGYSQAIVSSKLDVEKTNGSGTGEVSVQTLFTIDGDFTATVVATRTDLSGGAKLGLRVIFLDHATTAEMFLDGADGVEGVINGSSATQMVAATTATLCIRRVGGFVSDEVDTGSGFVSVQSNTFDARFTKVRARVDMVLVQGGTSIAAESGTLDDFTINADVIVSAPSATPTSTLIVTTPTPRPSPVTLDHFMSYAVKPTKGTASFEPLGPVTLTDAFVPAGADYDVIKPAALALPADKNESGVHDDATHLLEYLVKPSNGAPKFAPRVDVRLLNQCSDVTLVVKKPVSLLVPTAKSVSDPVDPPVEAEHEVDHFLCYRAKPEAKLASGGVLPKFPKGIQVDVADQFDDSQARRYDLKSITKLCVPTAKSGNPLFLKGAAKGTPATIAPASVRHADSLLVCYRAKLATTQIPQLGCGAVDPKSKGAKIDPKQPKHTPVIGIFVNNQLGPLQLDSVKELELCVPSVMP